MRLISLVIALAIIAIIVQKQLSGDSSKPINPTDASSSERVIVPSNPNELKNFEKDFELFLNNQVEQSTQKIEDAQK